MPLFDPKMVGDAWASEQQLFNSRMRDPELLARALAVMKADRLRYRIYDQKPLHVLLADEDHARASFRRAVARHAGSKKKTDALQKLIQDIAARRPEITEQELLNELGERQAVRDIVMDIDETFIHFSNGEALKKAKISGLKDRLSRARRHSR